MEGMAGDSAGVRAEVPFSCPSIRGSRRPRQSRRPQDTSAAIWRMPMLAVPLFHGYTFGEVPGLIHIVAQLQGAVVGE